LASKPIGDATACFITFDSLVKFAQEGWDYPLQDDPATRHAVYYWLVEHKIPMLTLPDDGQLKRLIGGEEVSGQSPH
jgi:hypothetical protein